jgi:hypothetical protein
MISSPLLKKIDFQFGFSTNVGEKDTVHHRVRETETMKKSYFVVFDFHTKWLLSMTHTVRETDFNIDFCCLSVDISC